MNTERRFARVEMLSRYQINVDEVILINLVHHEGIDLIINNNFLSKFMGQTAVNTRKHELDKHLKEDSVSIAMETHD